MRLKGFLLICCIWQSVAEFVDLTVEHSLGDDIYTPAGRLYGYLDDDANSNRILTLQREAAGTAERAAFAQLVTDDGLYKLRLPGGAGLEGELLTSLKARCLANSGFQDMLLLHATPTGKLVGMNYDLAALQCGAVGQMASLSGDWDFQSSSKVPVWVPVPAPTIRLSGSAKAPGVAFEELPDQKEAGGAGGEAKAPEKPKDERSWIMKNWMIALPVALLAMNVAGQIFGGQAEAAAPGANAAAAAAPRPAASGGSRGRR